MARTTTTKKTKKATGDVANGGGTAADTTATGKKKVKQSKLESFDMLHREGFACLADNSYIRSGYRLNYSFRDCFFSLFELHNETLNVWTHMVGSFIFLTLMAYLMLSNTALDRGNVVIPAVTWCQTQDPFYVEHGRHTPKMFYTTAAPKHCPRPRHAPFSSGHKKHYDVASIIFDHSIDQIPSLARFHHLLEDHVDGISHTVAAQMEQMKAELQLLKERLTHMPDATQIKAVRDKLNHRVDSFSSFLQGVATDVGADMPIQYALSELHGLADSVKNGIHIMSTVDTHHVPHWPIFVFMISAVICLTCSATFHLLFVYSKPAYFFLSRMDYAGITIMIAGSFYPLIYYAFYCHPWILRMYLTSISVLAGITFTISLVPAFGTSKYLLLRTGIFLSLGFFGVIPMVHLVWQFGLFDPHVTVMLGPLLLMAALYIVGATIYATRFPERFYPGRFDVWFSSHQLWHICVVAAALVHFVNALQHYEWRWNTHCDV
ncbi:TPA: hypothetical protein N0F65_001503 [Lagenidium giganteum]|uniref:Adiponectin receptor protein n=1 Tax=Lagenidium giganteum TaxID=4803 RepID=A0AAV2Z054_9STRA|nr:TPA: hypothetical protein N0F65_001503 [Lagenidium giganteum]